MKKWEQLGSRIAFPSKWMRIRQDKVRLPMGKTLDDYYVWVKGDIVIVIPFTKKGELIFIKQFRQGVRDFMIEFPTGFIDKGEKLLVTAKRELLEETGHQGEVESVGQLYGDSDKIVGKMYVCLARNVEPTEKYTEIIRNFEDNEEIEVLKISLKKALEMVKKGEIWATETVASLFLGLDKLGRLEKKA